MPKSVLKIDLPKAFSNNYFLPCVINLRHCVTVLLNSTVCFFRITNVIMSSCVKNAGKRMMVFTFCGTTKFTKTSSLNYKSLVMLFKICELIVSLSFL